MILSRLLEGLSVKQFMLGHDTGVKKRAPTGVPAYRPQERLGGGLLQGIIADASLLIGHNPSYHIGLSC